MYFTVNPIKGELHKKASKDDVAEARWLWVDMDPERASRLKKSAPQCWRCSRPTCRRGCQDRTA
jgi:hypothetical protein